MSLNGSRIGVSLPMLNQPYERYPEFASLAEDAGFDSVWDYEFFRNPFITHALNARATGRIQLGTGIATAAPRTPFEMANAAADVDELSGGRTILGLSTGGAGWMECFNGTDIDRPLTRLREYIQVIRQLWDHFETDEPFDFQGKIYRACSPPFNPWGTRNLVRPRIPIYLAGFRRSGWSASRVRSRTACSGSCRRRRSSKTMCFRMWPPGRRRPAATPRRST